MMATKQNVKIAELNLKMAQLVLAQIINRGKKRAAQSGVDRAAITGTIGECFKTIE